MLGRTLIVAIATLGAWVVMAVPVATAWEHVHGVTETTNAQQTQVQTQVQAKNHLREALKTCERALATSQSVDKENEKASLLATAAEINEQLAEFPEALKRYETALSIYSKLGEFKLASVMAVNIARIHKKQGPLSSSLDYYEKALQILSNLGDVQAEAATLMEMAEIYKLLEQPWRQLQCYEEVLEIEKGTQNIGGQAAALDRIASARSDLREEVKTQELYEIALAIQQKMGDLEGQTATLNNLALLRLKQGHYRNALKLCEKGLRLQQLSDDTVFLPRLLRTDGLIRQRLGQYERAVKTCLEAVAHAGKSGDPKEQVDSMKAVALVHLSQGDYPKALEFSEQAQRITQTSGDAIAEANILQNMAEVYGRTADFAMAHKALEKALAINKAAGIPTDRIAKALVSLHMESGDTEKAGQIISDSGLEGFDAARLCLKTFQFEKALSELRLGLNPSIEERFAFETLRGLAHEGLGNLQDALGCFKTATDIIEQIRDSLPEEQRRNLFDVKIFDVKRVEPYQGLCRVYLSLGKPYEAFRCAEMTKARAFADSLIGQWAREPASDDDRARESSLVPPNIVDEDVEWNNKFANLLRVQANKRGSFDPEVVKRIRSQRDHHVRKLRDMYPAFAASRYSGPMDLTETALRDDEWVLEYQITDPGVVIFLIQGKTIRKAIFKSVPRNELERLVRSLRETLEIDSDKDLLWPKLEAFGLDEGRRLGHLLLGDMLAILPSGVQLTVVPDDFLSLVPFEMLVLNDSGKISTSNPEIPCTSGVDFFGDRNPVSYYQSVTSLTLMRHLQRRRSLGNRLLAFADPIFDFNDIRLKRRAAAGDQGGSSDDASPSLPFLVMSARSRLTLHRLDATARLGKYLKQLDPEHTDVFEGPKATKVALLSKDLTPYHSIVFATHGYAGTDLPGIQEPALMLTLVDQPLGQDGFLRMSEVMRLRMNAGLVALTACKTGIGRYVSGEGTMFLGRAFQQAGADTVLISLWNVAQEPSVRLVESFFKNLRSGKTKLDSLRLARSQIRAAGYDHPFFWAAFILIGKTD